MVEFGASMGFSTIYLASAVKDLGAGRIITTELIAEKAKRLATNLSAAGLANLVETWVGDAMRTLADLDQTIDLLVLDGSNDLYLPVLQLCEPRLSSHGLVVADLSHDEPHHDRYRAYVSWSTGGLRHHPDRAGRWFGRVGPPLGAAGGLPPAWSLPAMPASVSDGDRPANAPGARRAGPVSVEER